MQNTKDTNYNENYNIKDQDKLFGIASDSAYNWSFESIN